jgi:hypothetical protein
MTLEAVKDLEAQIAVEKHRHAQALEDLRTQIHIIQAQCSHMNTQFQGRVKVNKYVITLPMSVCPDCLKRVSQDECKKEGE